MSVPTRRGQGEGWQYHSRSDRHSKVACWTLLFDLLLECDSFRVHAEQGRIGFGINHVMVGPINKTLDLVVTRVPPTRHETSVRPTFAETADRLGIVLGPEDRELLDGLPRIEEDLEDDVSEVTIALEAKACMTEHTKSLPRLHAEILATGYLAKRCVPQCIAVSYSLVNVAPTFRTSSVAGKVNRHTQPDDARRVIDMVAAAVPLARDYRNLLGYDVVGVLAIECRNDGSEVTIRRDLPRTNEHVHYERMVRALCQEYRARHTA